MNRKKRAAHAPLLRSGAGLREGGGPLAAGEAPGAGGPAAAEEGVVEAAVEGSGSRTKNWRGLSRARKMLGYALPLAPVSGSSDKKSAGLPEPLHTTRSC